MTEVKHTANNSFTLQSGWNHATLNDGIKTRQTSIICSHLYLTAQLQLQKSPRKEKLTTKYQMIVVEF